MASLIDVDDLRNHLRLPMPEAQVFHPTRVSSQFALVSATPDVRVWNEGAYDLAIQLGRDEDVVASPNNTGWGAITVPARGMGTFSVPIGVDRIALVTVPGSDVDPSDPARGQVLIFENDETTLLQNKIDTAQALAAAFLGSDDLAADFNPMPAPVLEAIRQWAGFLYENREGQGIPAAVTELLTPFRLTWTFG